MCHQTPLVELVPAWRRAVETLRPCAGRSMPGRSCFRKFQPKSLWRRMGPSRDRLARSLAQRRNARPRRRSRDRRSGPAGLRSSSDCSGTWPPSIAARSIRRTWTSICTTTASRPCGIAWKTSRPSRSSSRCGPAGCGAAAGPDFPRDRSGPRPGLRQARRNTSSATATKAIPGAFMDRMLLESFPYRIIEGMAIAARAVGADEGIFYIRAEYPLAVKRIREALHNLRRPRPAGRPRAEHRFPLAHFA